MIWMRSRYLSCSATRSGISARQGGHQVAQKLISTTLPWNDADASWWPSRSTAVNDGAFAGLRKNRSAIFSPAPSSATGRVAAAALSPARVSMA